MNGWTFYNGMLDDVEHALVEASNHFDEREEDAPKQHQSRLHEIKLAVDHALRLTQQFHESITQEAQRDQ